jgi:hypothetical protein
MRTYDEADIAVEEERFGGRLPDELRTRLKEGMPDSSGTARSAGGATTGTARSCRWRSTGTPTATSWPSCEGEV